MDNVFKPFDLGKFEVGYQFRNLDHEVDFVNQSRTSFDQPFQLIPEFSSEVNLKRTINAVYAQVSGFRKKWEYNLGARQEVADRRLELQDKIGIVDTTYVFDFVKLYHSASM